MSPQKHRIGRQVFEVEVLDEAQAALVHARLGALQGQRIESLIDACCSELSPPDRVHRIGRLEVDLGALDPEELEQSLAVKLGRALGEALALKIQAAEREAAELGEDLTTSAHIELLSQFARTGTLPFWADETRPEVAGEALSSALERDPAAACALALWLAKDRRSLVRLARHVKAQTLLRLFQSVIDVRLGRTAEARGAELWDLLSLSRGAAPAVPAAVLWAAALQVVSLRDGLARDGRELFREVLGVAAIEAGVPYKEVLDGLHRALPEKERAPSAGAGTAGAIAIVRGLWEELRPAPAAPALVGAQKIRREDGSPGREDGSPGREDGSPRREVGSPRREDGSPRREDGSPRREVGSPGREVRSPRREDGLPRREVRSPMREDESPWPEVKSPWPEVKSPWPEVKSPGLEVKSPWPELESSGGRPRASGVTSSPPPGHEVGSPWPEHESSEGRPRASGVTSSPPPGHEVGSPWPEHESSEGRPRASGVTRSPPPGHEVGSPGLEAKSPGLAVKSPGHEHESSEGRPRASGATSSNPPGHEVEPPGPEVEPPGHGLESLAGRPRASGSTPSSPPRHEAVSLGGRRQAPPVTTPARPPVRPAAGPVRRALQEQSEPEAAYVDNAGAVLLWPFFDPFFKRLGLTAKHLFIDTPASHRAAGLLHYLATGSADPPEYRLPLTKVLCGLDMDEPFDFGPPMTDAESAECDALLGAVLDHARALGDIDIDMLRRAFLLRRGALRAQGDTYLLTVERAPYDAVLAKLPWPSSWVHAPWMKAPLCVEWPK